MLFDVEYRKTCRLQTVRDFLHYDIINVESTRSKRSRSSLHLDSNILTCARVVIKTYLKRLISCAGRFDNLDRLESSSILRIGHYSNQDRITSIRTLVFTRVEFHTQAANAFRLRQDSILILRIVIGITAIVRIEAKRIQSGVCIGRTSVNRRIVHIRAIGTGIDCTPAKR